MKKQSSDYIEMLFENRNKEYGAYDLRVNYEKRLFISFGMALLIAGLFFLIPYVLTQILTERYISKKSPDSEIIYDLTKKYVIERPKIQTSITGAGAKAASANTTYKVVSKIEEKKVPDQKAADPGASAQNSGSATIASGPDSSLPGDGNSFATDSQPSEPMSVASVEFVPEFPGGENALLKFMAKNIHYPAEARENGITGKVYVCFVINEKGKTESIRIMRSLGFGTDEEVIRVISLMPEWKPGRYHNMNVKTAFAMPVFFSLK